MPEIAGFGKHFYFYKAWDKKVSPQRAMGDPMDEVKRPRKRVAIFPTGQPLARARLGL